MHQEMRSSVIGLLLLAAAGCAAGGARYIAPLSNGWTREDLRSRSWTTCGSGECRNTLRTPRGPLLVATRVRSYGLHEIPGWKGSTAGRVASGVLEGLLRRQGVATERVDVRLGTHTISDSAATPWTMRCSVYSIDDQTEEYSKAEDDHITETVRRSEGAHCLAFDAADSAVVLWRFRSGIGPSRDSLAAAYDSLAKTDPMLVSARPPMSLERFAPGGAVAARYEVSREDPATMMERFGAVQRVKVAREGGIPVAIVHVSEGTTVDIAPEATPEEVRIVRLVAALVAVQSR